MTDLNGLRADPLMNAVRCACLAQRASVIAAGRVGVWEMLLRKEVTLDEVGQAVLDLEPLGDEWVFERACELWESLGEFSRARELLAARAAEALP